jgi:hypothetical protein
VVGESDRAQARGGGARHHRAGREPPVGRGRVDVEIDRRAWWRLPGGGQRR